MFFNKRNQRHDSGFIKIDITKRIEWNEPNGEGCFASDKITKEGFAVGYMYRETPDEGVPDSGWRFFAGDEDEDYTNNPDNTHLFKLNTLCNYDEYIIPYLHSKPGSAYIRIDDTHFELDDGTKPAYITKQK